MNKPHLCFALAGICLCSIPKACCQSAANNNAAPSGPEICDTCKAAEPVAKAQKRVKLWQDLRFTGGQLTIPFKIRRKAEHGTFRLTTDVTLGAFIGLQKRLSEQKNYYLTFPVTAGLSFININDSNTSVEYKTSEEGGTDVVPGLSWSTGLILQMDRYSLGFICGKDYASEVGDQWIYHRKWWWSFGLGFSFTK